MKTKKAAWILVITISFIILSSASYLAWAEHCRVESNRRAEILYIERQIAARKQMEDSESPEEKDLRRNIRDRMAEIQIEAATGETILPRK